MRVLLVSDSPDWHARRMKEAFAKRGAEAVRLDLCDIGFSTQRAPGLDLPGFARLPDVVHVRTMAGGTFEAITRRLGVLHALAGEGVPVVNAPRAIEACVDKSMTTFQLARAGLPTPDTWTVESQEAARARVRAEIERGPLVLKPLFGAQGRGLKLLTSPDDLPPPEAVAGVYYLQRFEAVDAEDFRDYRVLVAGGRALATMMRRSAHWVTNVKQGGEPVAVAPDPQLDALALAAARAVGAQIAGVDLIVGREGPKVLEVNSMPAWRGLQKTTAVDLALSLADAVLSGAGR